MKLVIIALILAGAIAFGAAPTPHSAKLIPTGPVPTCNPFTDPNCTLDTGCQGGPCLVE